MRVGEFTKLRVEDIDFEERFITIPAESTKTKEARTIFVPREVLNDIRAYLKLEKKKKGKIFELATRRVQQLLKKYSEIAGVEATPHTLRHSHIVHSLLDRVPITAVQKQVGHRQLTTTQIYATLHLSRSGRLMREEVSLNSVFYVKEKPKLADYSHREKKGNGHIDEKFS